MCERNITKLIIDNTLSIFEKDTNLMIDGKRYIKNTIYLFDKDLEDYIQIYKDEEEYKICGIFKEIPSKEYQFTDYTLASIRYL